MSDSTPLQKLDDAVHEYFDACDDEGALSGWVLAFQSSKLTDNPELIPLSFASDFTMSAGTSPELALGLARLTMRRIEVMEASAVDDE